MKSLQERFWAKVDRQSPDECWNWLGCITATGYGRIGRSGTSVAYAHRVSYELHNGQIPEGLLIDHKCHNRACVNPAHLQAVTYQQNAENRSGLNADNTSGARGVYWDRNRYHAQIGHKRTTLYIGRFESLDEAKAAYEAKARELHTNNLALSSEH